MEAISLSYLLLGRRSRRTQTTRSPLVTTATISSPAATHSLTPQQIKQFHTQGYLAPLTACSPEEMADYYPHIDKVMATDPIGGKNENKPCCGHNRHIDDLTMFRISTLPAILGAMRSVMGNDLILWRTNFFDKPPGAKEIPWHQDHNYWPLEPEIVISAWIAFDHSTVENACLQVIPGSHRKILHHVKATPDMAFHEMAQTQGLDMSKKVDVELRCHGQFVLFNERIFCIIQK